MKKFILLATVAISMVACNSEDNYIEEPVAALVSATISGSDLTRAHDVSWDQGDNIGVSMSNRYLNIQYTTENGDGVFDGEQIYFKNKVDPETLTAYYPYSGSEGQALSAIETSTTSERQTDTEQRKFDFLYDKKENVTGMAPNVNFTFKHMMSKLTLNFINGDAVDVKKITSCEINGLVLEGTFNPVTGECAAKADAPSSPLNLTPAATDDKMSLSIIIFPQTINNDKLSLKIHDQDNQDYACELNFGTDGLVSGNNYTFTIKVSKTGLKLDYSISPWTTVEDNKNEATSED